VTHLCQRLAIGLDVVSAPQNKRDSLWVVAAVLNALALKQAIHHNLGALQCSLCGRQSHQF
jgi:hypothetical protein